MKRLLLFFLITTFYSTLFGQNLTQTVRGVVVDHDSEFPLYGASIIIIGQDSLQTFTNTEGAFKFENVPVGKVTLVVASFGYAQQLFPNIVVNSGKETILTLALQESITQLEGVTISVDNKKGEVQNEMSVVSSRSISAEETNRYAGSFNDPSRITSNFAGVTNTQDGSNDIIIRGNSPKYMQWRLEGTEITNPNHFGDQNGITGGISALNNNLLATSDFHTGAFSPQFGDVISGVYDIKLRKGNNEKFESTFGFGILGTDFTMEGPFKKGYGGSFLANYRYSNTGIIDALGLIDVGGIPKFQDATLKIVLPTKSMGVFSLYGLGALSSFSFQNVQPDIWDTPGDRNLSGERTEDFEKVSFLLNTGLKHFISINDHSFIRSTLSYSVDGIDDEVIESSIITQENEDGSFTTDTVNATPNFKNTLQKSAYRASVQYNNKLDAKNKVLVGTNYSLFDFKNNQSILSENNVDRMTLIDFDNHIHTLRNFVSWKHRFNDKILMVAGLHNMNVLYNKKSTLEPRIAFKWKVKENHSISLGYGSHSTMENVRDYFITTTNEDGSTNRPNQDLDLLKAHHFVFGCEENVNQHVKVKMDIYYQYLYNLPVENDKSSYYATINEGSDSRYVDLVNEGTGKNYGIEMTVEHFFSNNYYYLINGSLYNSKYTALDGKERNTQYNGNYLVNVLAGKEFSELGKKKNRSITLNTKIFYGGGKRYIPLLRDNNGDLAVDPATNQYWDYDNAYEDRLQNIYQITLSATYKVNRPKATHEIFINLDNVTNAKGKITEFYDESQPNSIGYMKQFGFFPNLMYKASF